MLVFMVKMIIEIFVHSNIGYNEFQMSVENFLHQGIKAFLKECLEVYFFKTFTMANLFQALLTVSNAYLEKIV